MSEKILVVYASWAGSTANVAETVGLTLSNDGIPVDVRPVEEIKGSADLNSYRAVVAGSAIRAGKPHPDMLAFLKANGDVLSRAPVAYFVVCLTMQEDTEENRCTVRGYLDELLEKVPQVQPVGIGLFAGALNFKKLPLPMRLIMKAMKAEEGEFYDWDAVRQWVNDIRPALTGA
jgi:menaquinone-dependent protoporphyrinogen oxidase